MKKIRKALTLVVVFSMMTSFAYIPVAQAASLTNVSDTVSTSAPSTIASHTIDYDTAVLLDDSGYVEITFDVNYSTIPANGDIACGANGIASGGGTRVARCTYSPAFATGTQQIIISNVTNPTAGFYDVDIATYTSGGVEQEIAKVINAVIDTVTVTAHVDSTLTFSVNAIASGQDVNGETTTAASTATTTPFGNLNPATPSIVGQELQVTTNASAGFQVTVTQNSAFDTAAGAIIDSFIDGSATTTPNAWTAPSGTLADDTTWGHLGFTTDDQDSTSFGANEYAGLTVGSAFVLMGHTGPSSATEADAGLTRVAYAVQINALQEAGDYETTLTYIATPTY